MPGQGQKRRLEGWPVSSGLSRYADNFRARPDFALGPEEVSTGLLRLRTDLFFLNPDISSLGALKWLPRPHDRMAIIPMFGQPDQRRRALPPQFRYEGAR